MISRTCQIKALHDRAQPFGQHSEEMWQTFEGPATSQWPITFSTRVILKSKLVALHNAGGVKQERWWVQNVWRNDVKMAQCSFWSVISKTKMATSKVSSLKSTATGLEFWNKYVGVKWGHFCFSLILKYVMASISCLDLPWRKYQLEHERMEYLDKFTYIP